MISAHMHVHRHDASLKCHSDSGCMGVVKKLSVTVDERGTLCSGHHNSKGTAIDALHRGPKAIPEVKGMKLLFF
jgi:hypothetical protein